MAQAVPTAILGLLTARKLVPMLRAAMPVGAPPEVHHLAVITAYAGALFAAAAPLLYALPSGFLIWLACRLAGAALSYGRAYSLAIWSVLPANILGGGIKSVLMMQMMGSLTDPQLMARLGRVSLGPAALLAPEAAGFLPGLLGSLDLFNLWAAALAAIGCAVWTGSGRKPALAAGLAAYLLYLGAALWTWKG